jgi:propionyl-CoA carboxylase beta chain
VTQAELGGTQTHSTITGLAHFASADDRECLAGIRRLMTFLPSNNTEDPPWQEPSDSPERTEPVLNLLIPTDPNLPYDMKELIRAVVDDGDFLEVHARFARNLIVGFARLAGYVVGIVANQPSVLAGTLDIDSSIKGARFVRFCDAFNIPLIIFEDVPGFLPGVSQEHGGIIRHGAKLLFAFAEATVPKLTVITRKAYGGAYCVMASKHIRADVNLAFPTAEIAVMGPEGAVEILFAKQLQSDPDPETLKKERVHEFREKLANPYVAAERGYIDEVIEPSRTRPKLIRALEMCANKRDTNPPKKHGNIPL